MKKIILSVILLGLSLNLFAEEYYALERRGSDFIPRLMTYSETHTIKDFSTDGCSLFPDGYIPTQTTEWLDCCIIHDIDYWTGGDSYLRQVADENLGYCASNESHPAIGITMRIGVTIAGGPSPMPWRWGYGWDFAIGYNSLDLEQLRSAASKFETIIAAIQKERKRLTNLQRTNIVNKLNDKLLEMLPYFKGDDGAVEKRFNFLKQKINQLVD